ncbi:MAG TPA: ATP synthase F1 subunit delta [Vicinamibacterales bacterium]|nr:ATP synthase F1 subunit delta [Vicinamibacterales bacterium]
MSNRAVQRYASALFDVAQKAGSTEAAAQSLEQIGSIVTGHEELSRVLASPAIPASVKRDIILAIVDAVGGAPAEVRRMVGMLAERDRLAELPDVAAAFGEQVMESRRVMRADVVTAVPLSDASRSALTEALGRASGKTVTLTARVDPSIIGGVIAKVGSFVYDASLTRQLERMRETLTAATHN